MRLDIVLRGQSNALLLREIVLRQQDGWTGGDQLVAEVQRLLGFDGVQDSVALVYGSENPRGLNTVRSGSAFIGDWVERNPVSGAWQVNFAEGELLARLADHTASPQRGAEAAVVWLHSEFDARRAGLSVEEWTSAVRFDADLVRRTTGTDAASLPYVFISAHPYSMATDAGHQAIRLGMERLAADPTFGARIGARVLDVNADYDNRDGNPFTTEYGGEHIAPPDAWMIADRVARALAEVWADHAKPGSPVALAGGDIAGTGPQAVSAWRVDADTLRVADGHDRSLSLRAPLDPEAAQGVGWSARSAAGGAVDAVAARIVGPAALEIDFAAPVPEGGMLHYGWGYGLARGNAPGQGNAIYDAEGQPIWVAAAGLPVGAAPAPAVAASAPQVAAPVVAETAPPPPVDVVPPPREPSAPAAAAGAGLGGIGSALLLAAGGDIWG